MEADSDIFADALVDEVLKFLSDEDVRAFVSGSDFILSVSGGSINGEIFVRLKNVVNRNVAVSDNVDQVLSSLYSEGNVAVNVRKAVKGFLDEKNLKPDDCEFNGFNFCIDWCCGELSFADFSESGVLEGLVSSYYYLMFRSFGFTFKDFL